MSVFAMEGITKAFPGVKALSDVSFACAAGEVHALVGENGAGKSTLMKILSGVYQPDAGRVVLGGETVRFRHPVDAIAAGVSVIHQEFSLLPDRTVAQNIFLGREPSRRGIVDERAMERDTARILKSFTGEHGISPQSLVGDLSIAAQQMVEIAKAVSVDAKVLVFDEPTAALDEAECEILFAIVEDLARKGIAIVYITHRMREVTRLADRVTVLKDGEIAARFDDVPEPQAIVAAMVGRDIGEFYPPPAEPEEIGGPLLVVEDGGNARLKNIALTLRAGEIVGLAGVQGAGRTALAAALFGAEPFTQGRVSLAGARVDIASPRAAIAAGIVMLPGDRKAEGLVLMQSVRDNAMLAARAAGRMLSGIARTPFGTQREIDALLKAVDVRAGSFDQEIATLSGGNQQKAILARWLALKPRVLLFVEPTRGVDVNAKAGIYRAMRELARGGSAILMVSSDLPEVLGVADRVLVMQAGRIVSERPRGTSEADIMHDATGEAHRVAA
ncbi:sugar ABC transporter ATP-binding protein [Acuticoccus sp. M5D2P5]|uniref:sugar ABC transporter ATP-binding protein n=1 Tax=Acuticoccus kalidii TaxID=2910977 RepID=UPI001F22A62C|nr:sugar ABC transporter ATP-binding protein [Acuticoccus kalidii]MCF3933587.1 sugar ABC transporter ATP-binding protein [Acuticoccus kalidii]